MRVPGGIRLPVLAALVLALTSPNLRSQDLSPDLGHLQDLVQELAEIRPPLDPGDAASIVADTTTALGNLSGSAVPYRGVPEGLLGARFGMRIANLLYHRFGQPQDAATVLGAVQSVYAAHPAGAPYMASVAGDRSSETGQLPPDFSPGSKASDTSPCDLGEGERGAIENAAFNGYEELQISPPYDPQSLVSFTCTLESDPGTGGSVVWLVVMSSGSGASPITMRVYRQGAGNFWATPDGGGAS